MKLLDYIKGQRKGKDAHRIEKDSMLDPFLYEAIEGFDSIDDNHAKRINEIQNRLKAKSNTKTIYHRVWQIAATAAILILGLGGYLFIDYHKSDLYAQQLGNNSIIDIYVPETFYVENITSIAYRNAEAVKTYNPKISRFKPDEKTSSTLSKEELDILAKDITGQQEEILIDIYLPEDFDGETYDKSSIKNGKSEPIGGYVNFNLYLKKSLRPPTDDICRDRKGKVAVEFSVNEEGRPYLFEVKYSLCGTSDNEAIRLIQSGPRWTRGTERVVVKVEF